ncbi:MAG: hypothetical protein PQJ46_12045 [Spirochaetales bacterium]|nr:hypothetical protein [Spirochaetales bacterium]
MNPYYELSKKVQKVLIEDVKEGVFPEAQLRMCYRLFSTFPDINSEKYFLDLGKKEFQLSQRMDYTDIAESPFSSFFDFPRSLYIAQDLINKAIGEKALVC